jgi:cytoskeletal protein CcmA (bactofilin family)
MKYVFFLALVMAFQSAGATEFQYGKEVIISKPVYGNLYIAGGGVTLNAPVYGDLMVAGGNVFINDTVTNDILIAGGKVILNGYATEDVRCAGGTVRISKSVKGDVVLAGGEVLIEKGVSVGNLIASAGKITIDGTVAGMLKGAFGELLLNGNVVNGMDCRGQVITINGIVDGPAILSAPEINIGSGAGFDRDVRYWNRRGSLAGAAQIRNGRAIYDPSLRVESHQWYYLGATTLLGLFWYLGMAIILIMLIQYVLPGLVKRSADTLSSHPSRSLAYGVLLCIAIPVCAAIALVSVIAVPVGILLLIAYVVLILLAATISAVVMANLVNRKYNKNWTFMQTCGAAFGFFVLLKLAALTPFLGSLVMLLVALAVFGAVLMSVPWKHRDIKATVRSENL